MERKYCVNLNFKLSIASPIPESLAINGCILVNSKIADKATEGEIALRQCIINREKSENNDSFWKDNIEKISFLDKVSFLGLNVLKNLQDEYNKTGNKKYYLAINQYINSFFEWLDDDFNKLDLYPEAIYNRTYILIKLLLDFREKWEYYEVVCDFLYRYQVKYIINDTDQIGLTYKINSNISLILLAELFNLDEVKLISNNNIKNILKEDFDKNILARESSFTKQGYYLNLLKQYIELMRLYGKYDNAVWGKVNKGLDSLAIILKHNNNYPAIDRSVESKAIVNSISRSKWYREKDICIFKNDDLYCLYKCNSVMNKQNHCDCGSIIFSYKGRDIFIDSGHSTSNNIDVNKNCESYEGHSMPIFKDKVAVSPQKYWELIDNNKTKINRVKFENCNSQFYCNSSIFMNNEGINRSIYFKEKKLIILDDYECIDSKEFESRFILHPNCKNIEINDRVISFFNKGIGVQLKVITEVNDVDIRVQKSYYCVNGNKFNDTNAIIFNVKGRKNKLRFEVILFDDKLDDYENSKDSFLCEKIELQIKRALESNFLKDITKYCNIGSTELYRHGRKAYLNQDFEISKRCEILNSVLHNCSIKSTCDIGKGTRLAYGGIGLLIHANSKIGKYCMVGANVTLAAAPTIEDFVYIATGARVIKPNCKIGSFCIIGANAVINKDIEPFSVVGGVPAKVIKKITPNNVERYLVAYLASTGKTDQKFIEYVRNEFYKTYNKHNNE